MEANISLVYLLYMASKAVQISLDEQLLHRVDKSAEARKLGRSGFIRQAILLYFKHKEQRSLDQQIKTAYADQADTLYREIEDLIGTQSWPEK